MIVLLTLFGILMIAFILVQCWKQEKATVPPRIFVYRSIWASTLFAFCISGSLTIIVYYLPLYFQAIQGVSAIESGIRSLPLILALVVASIIAGGLVSKIGYFTPLMIACSIIISIACGLLTTWEVDTSEAVWIGYQVVFGFGMGLGQQQAGLAAQAVLPKEDVATGVSLKFFGQTLGGAVFVAVAQNVLNNRLVDNLAGLDLPGLDAEVIVNTGATDLRAIVPVQYLEEVLVGYNGALTDVFMVAVAVSCLSLVGAALTEWKSVKGLRGGARGSL
jgi:MFS family permease